MNNLIKQRINRVIKLTTNDNSLIKSKLPKFTKSIDSIVDLGFENGKYLKRVSYTYYLPTPYETLVNAMVKERYSDSEEFAILRKAISNGITDEYRIYNLFVEDCKVRAKQFIEERNAVLGV